MRIPPFELERLQSVYEHQVEINLSESGVEPLDARTLLGMREGLGARGADTGGAGAGADEGGVEALGDAAGALLDQPLGYSQTNGTPELRAAIAATLPGATEAEVLATNGGAEANFVACWHLVEPGDEVVVMLPNYLQIQGLAESFGAIVRPWRLRVARAGGGRRWAPDLDELHALVTPRTRAIVICNPNNPTGARLTADEVAAVCDIAGRHGAWVLADEIYRGAERDGVETPTAWGRTDRVIVTGGLSKAYGLPGLRIGWAVAPRAIVDALWARRDYTTIAPGALNDRLARLALAPARRAALIERARRIIRDNFRILSAWVDAQGPDLTCVPPEAGALAFIRYGHAIGSTALATRLRETERVLVPPGDHFGIDGHLRIGFGGPPDALRAGLARLDRVLNSLPRAAPLPAGT